MSEYDSSIAFMPLAESQAYFNRSGDVTAIEVYTQNPDRIDSMRQAVTAAAAKGTAVYNGDGTFTYTATAGQEGLDTFQYTITDQDGDTSTATVTVNLGTDSVPSLVGSASSLTVDEDGFGNAAVDTVTTRTAYSVPSGSRKQT